MCQFCSTSPDFSRLGLRSLWVGIRIAKFFNYFLFSLLGSVDQGQNLPVGAAQNLALTHPVELVEATQGHQGDEIAVLDQGVLAEKDLLPDHALNLVQNQGSLLPSPVLAQGHLEIESPNHSLDLPDREGRQALTEIEEPVG